LQKLYKGEKDQKKDRAEGARTPSLGPRRGFTGGGGAVETAIISEGVGERKRGEEYSARELSMITINTWGIQKPNPEHFSKKTCKGVEGRTAG